jgi:multiple sugar transport system substrate-binding protein
MRARLLAWRWTWGVGVALVFACLLAGCARRHEDTTTTTIRFWVMGYEGDMVAQMLPDFERTHPGIKVSLQQLPVTAAHEKLLTAFAGDALPDVSPLGNTWISEFAALDALEPLDPWLARTPDIVVSDYFAGAWDTGVIDGKTLAIPWYVETRLPFYRKDIVAAAGVKQMPRTWAEWRAAMRAVKKYVGPDRYAILLPLNEYEPMLNLAVQQPDPLLRDGGTRGNFRSAGFKRTLQFYKDTFDEGLAPRVDNTRISNVWQELGRGYFSYYVNGPWNIAEFEKRLPADVAGSWSTMPLPGPDGPGASVAGGTSFVVFKGSRHKEAAWQLIAWLSEPAQEIRLHAITGNPPPRRAPWSAPALAHDPYIQAFRDQLERAVAAPKVPEWERIAQEMRFVGELVANDRLTVDEAAAEMDRRADRILEKRRWMLAHHRLPGGAP